MKRTRRAPPPWTSAPGLATSHPMPGPSPPPPLPLPPSMPGSTSTFDRPEPERLDERLNEPAPVPRERPRRTAALTVERRGRFPKRRLAGILAAAAAFTVVGGVLSAQSARPGAPDSVTAPPTALPQPAVPMDAPTDPTDPTGNGPITGTGTGSDAADAPTTAPEQQRPPPRAAALVAHQTSQLGAVVVDADGFTLYRFDDDSAGDATCTGACASTWPPATVDPDARLALEGVDTSKVGLVRRRDGSYQLTISSWPVYRFAGDSRPGTFTGQGIGDSWFAITPTGAKAVPP